MIGLKESFGSVSFEQWIDRLKKDLKSEDLHELNKFDEIENFGFTSYSHEKSLETDTTSSEITTSDSKTQTNNWKNAVFIDVNDEKEANSKALEVLMKGADALHFSIQKSNINWEMLLEKIGLEYIFTEFTLYSTEQFAQLHAQIGSTYARNIAVNFDLVNNQTTRNELKNIISTLNGNYYPILLVDGYSLQQCGANITEELAFCLATGNEYLISLIDAGLTIDQAVSCIHFKMGVGAHYFQEIAKFKSFKNLWQAVVREYHPNESSSYDCMISAQIGTLNKSLEDPYTNLLRQTTEVMSASIAGVHRIAVLPYDITSENGVSQLSERMALNISLILKEESYFDQVIDPINGSYSVEQLSATINEKAWALFGEIDEKRGVLYEEALQIVRNNVLATAQKRVNRAGEKKDTLIGINKFTIPAEIAVSYKKSNNYLGLPQLILERELTTAKA
jgi:methylmalonyl-CoA mutase